MWVATLLFLVLLTFDSEEIVAEARIVDTKCRNSSFMEGETAAIHFSIRQDIDFANDPHLVMFIKKDDLAGNLIQCDRKNQSTTLVCSAPNDRFLSQGLLMGNELSIIIPSASSSQQGFYELHVVANGAFDPPVGCYLFLEDEAGAQPGEGESGNTMAVVIAVILSAVLLLIVSGIVFILRRRKHVKSKHIADQIPKWTSVNHCAHAVPDRGYSNPSEQCSVMTEAFIPPISSDTPWDTQTNDRFKKIEEEEDPSSLVDKQDSEAEHQAQAGGLATRLMKELYVVGTPASCHDVPRLSLRNPQTVDPESATAIFNALAAGQPKPQREELIKVTSSRAENSAHSRVRSSGKKPASAVKRKKGQISTDDRHGNTGSLQTTTV